MSALTISPLSVLVTVWWIANVNIIKVAVSEVNCILLLFFVINKNELNLGIIFVYLSVSAIK